MLIRLIIWGAILYFAYLFYKSFKALKNAAQQNINATRPSDPKKEKKFDASNAENIDYEEVDKEN